MPPRHYTLHAYCIHESTKFELQIRAYAVQGKCDDSATNLIATPKRMSHDVYNRSKQAQARVITEILFL